MTDSNLWSFNTPANFWLIQDNLSEDLWNESYERSIPLLQLSGNYRAQEIGNVLALTLGEERYNPNHWILSQPKRAYYKVKPFLPRSLTLKMRQFYSIRSEYPDWPINDRYVHFLWEVLHQILMLTKRNELRIRSLWPRQSRFALVLTHDIEESDGQDFVKQIADLEESLGFRSSFQFVPERYSLNLNLMDELRERGFEVGVHSLSHDGKLFSSYKIFSERVERINFYLKNWNAVGFRADLMHRQPDWMQLLNVEYDLSFFDTDPFEPISGGTMSIWPFHLGHFIELPYTLVQDYSLTALLKQKSPKIWLDKVDFIEKYHGMALLNSHPDYLRNADTFNIYSEFLRCIKQKQNYWHALPRDVARWWRDRSNPGMGDGDKSDDLVSKVTLENGELSIS